MPDPTPSTCETCGGNGYQDSDLCPTCLGGGMSPVTGQLLLFKTLFSTLETRADEIIAEQAAQREDLTNALTQIWNKVKDL